MSRRYRQNRSSSRRSFKRGANRVHRKNSLSGANFVMRGGIRL